MTWTTQPRSKIGRLSVIRADADPEIVLIHGVGLRAEAWGAQIGALRGAMAVDMPGHGQSARLKDSPQLANFADAIAEIMTKPSVVIGHSFGAMIALDLASRYPQLVKGVATLNAIFQRDQQAKASVAARANSLDGQTTADPSATLVRWFGDSPSPARDACRDWLCNVDAAGYRDAYRVFATEDGPSEKSLMALNCPALFITGENEPNSTPCMSQRMAELAALGRAEIVEGAAHMMPMTHAAEVNAVLDDFILECTK